MRGKAAASGERQQIIELVSAGMATTLGLLGVFCGIHAGIISSQAARYGFSALVSVLAAMALVGVVYTIRYGYEQLAAWLLIMVVAARVIVETTATAPHRHSLRARTDRGAPSVETGGHIPGPAACPPPQRGGRRRASPSAASARLARAHRIRHPRVPPGKTVGLRGRLLLGEPPCVARPRRPANDNRSSSW